ncbi:MAG: glucosamine-6-phosphate deaminase [Victivallaceae bacterium]|nr:glucosamine-6-phosphate deaminase [Victivallaceae bacterium]
MEVIIRKNAAEAVKLAAELIGKEIQTHPALTLGLATGRTMEALYAAIAAKNLDFTHVHTFNLDEYIGLAPENENSYRYYMNSNLFDHINIPKANTNLPNGMAADEKAEGARYEAAIRAVGGIDLQLLGIGRDGHIGFNEPGSSFGSRTRSKALTRETYEQNSPLFDDPKDMPMRAFTMGIGTILEAKRIVMLVTGTEKADIIAKAIEGPLSAMVSGSAIQLHPNVVVILDEEAAAKLTLKDYYQRVFEVEPEWKPYR